MESGADVSKFVAQVIHVTGIHYFTTRFPITVMPFRHTKLSLLDASEFVAIVRGREMTVETIYPYRSVYRTDISPRICNRAVCTTYIGGSSNGGPPVPVHVRSVWPCIRWKGRRGTYIWFVGVGSDAAT